MHDGGIVRNVATWHVLIEGVDGMTLGFPATFQFPWVIGFKNLSFFFTLVFLSFFVPSVCPFFFACFCHHPNSAPATLTLLRRL